jgi:hypothetical protein
MRFTHAARRWTARVAALLLVAAVLFAVQSASRLAAPAGAASAKPHLLLIHGWTDNCATAWNSKGSYTASLDSNGVIQYNDTNSADKVIFKTTEPNNIAAYDYLTTNTTWSAADIRRVGY